MPIWSNGQPVSETGFIKAVVVGAGGHAQMMAAVLNQYHADHVTLVAWVATETPSEALPELSGEFRPCLPESPETWAHLKAEGVTHFLFGLGLTQPPLLSNPIRWRVFQTWLKQGFKPLTLIHPSAYVAESAHMGEGVYIGAQAVIQPYAHVGDAVIVNTAAVVEHHNRVSHGAHIACNATLCGHVTIGEHSMIGAASVITQGITLPAGVMVKAGECVKPSNVAQYEPSSVSP